jgi:DNA-binding cell septation regulator SpoVG
MGMALPVIMTRRLPVHGIERHHGNTSMWRAIPRRQKNNASFSDDIRPAIAKNNELGAINNKHPITKDHLLQKAAFIHAAEREMCLWTISVLFW